MLLARVLQRAHGEVKDVTGHFPFLGHRIKATELYRFDALNVVELVKVALVDRALKQISDVAENFLASRPRFLLGQCDNIVIFMRLNHLDELLVDLLHLLLLLAHGLLRGLQRRRRLRSR